MAPSGQFLIKAIELSARGLHVFPCDHPDQPKCIGAHSPENPCDGKRGKHPACAWKTYAATNTNPMITDAWKKRGGLANVGVACGASGLVVLDEDEFGEMDRWCTDMGITLPETYVVTTARGRHFYFGWDHSVQRIGNREKAFAGYKINVRGEGGLVIGEGSQHESGTVYAGNNKSIAGLPQEVADKLLNGAPPSPSSPQSFFAQQAAGDPNATMIPFGERHPKLVEYAGRLLGLGLDYYEAEAAFRKRWLLCEQPDGQIPEAQFHTATCSYPVEWDNDAQAKLASVYNLYAAAPAGVAPPPPPSGAGAALLEDLRTWFARFIVVVDKTDLQLLALWVVHSYLCIELYTSPRLLIDSIAPGSGKTTVLEHLDHLCLKPMPPAVSVSSAALIPRILAKEMRTILLDEIQRTLVEGKPGVDEVIAVINSGYRSGATRPVLVPKGKDWVLKDLPTFAPLAMAGNSPNLPQDAVDRSIRILLMPDVDGLAADTDWQELDTDVKALQLQVAVWADSVRADVGNTKGLLPTGCVGRLREKWRPLMRVAELADGAGHEWKDVVTAMAEADIEDMEAEREDGLRKQAPAMVLMQDLYLIWPLGKPFMPTEELLRLLIPHNPDYWGPGFYNGAPRKALNATRFGRMVKQAAGAMSTRESRVGPRGYVRQQFVKAWRTLKIIQGAP